MHTLSASELEQQFLTAYRDFSDAIFRHCLLRVFDRELARDLTQETFTRTWTYIAEGKTIENVRAFLYRVATNLIINEVRRKKPYSLDALHEQGFNPGAASSALEEAETHEITAVFAVLASPYREAVILRYIDGFSPKEIAEMLGESENVVSVRIHRGIKKAQEILQTRA